jgi:hypothetical protein
MAQVIEIYIPNNFRKGVKWVRQPLDPTKEVAHQTRLKIKATRLQIVEECSNAKSTRGLSHESR